MAQGDENKGEFVKRELKAGLWEHFKGHEVIVIGEALDGDDRYVVYIHVGQDTEGRFNGLWHRPYDMFFDTKEKDGQTVNRFGYVGEGTPTITSAEVLNGQEVQTYGVSLQTEDKTPRWLVANADGTFTLVDAPIDSWIA